MLPEMDKPPVINGRPMAPPVVEIIDSLKEAMTAGVELIDLDEACVHAKMSTWWFTYTASVGALRSTVAHQSTHGNCVDTRINRRWVLRVMARAGVSTDLLQLAVWAAQKLAPYLPVEPELAMLGKRGGRGGGSAPPAEVGIPVWWVRRVRS
jgi:hypothetical protein